MVRRDVLSAVYSELVPQLVLAHIYKSSPCPTNSNLESRLGSVRIASQCSGSTINILSSISLHFIQENLFSMPFLYRGTHKVSIREYLFQVTIQKLLHQDYQSMSMFKSLTTTTHTGYRSKLWRFLKCTRSPTPKFNVNWPGVWPRWWISVLPITCHSM